MIGQRDAGNAVVGGATAQRIDAAGTVEQRILAMNVEMDERRIGHGIGHMSKRDPFGFRPGDYLRIWVIAAGSWCSVTIRTNALRADCIQPSSFILATSTVFAPRLFAA